MSSKHAAQGKKPRLLRLFLGLVGLLMAGLAAQPSLAVLRTTSTISGWTTPVPLLVDPRPALQSEPSIALAGDHTVISWADSRNAAPDLYTLFLHNDQPADAIRATNLAPNLDTQPAAGAAVVIEASGRAFAVYTDGEQIYLVRYDANNNGWSQPLLVRQAPDAWHGVARYPHLATDGAGDLIIVWEDFRNADSENDWANSRGSDIYAARCDGDTLTCPGDNIKINQDETRHDQRRPRVARLGSQVAVIWEDHREFGAERPQVYVARSDDGGSSWGNNERISTPTGAGGRRRSAARPTLAYAPDGALFAAWEDQLGATTAPADIVAVNWNGASWSQPQRVDAAPVRARALAPTLAAGAAGVFVAWQDHRSGASNPDIYAARWDGASWSEQAVTTAPAMQIQPMLAADGDKVRVVWQDTGPGVPRIFSAAWTGDGWSSPLAVGGEATRSTYQMAPTLASADGVSYAVYVDNRTGFNDLWLTTLPADASDWADPQRLPTSVAVGGGLDTRGAQIVVDGGGRLHAVWSEYLWPYGQHILYSVYQNGRWRDPVRLSGSFDNGRGRRAPSLAEENGILAVAWSETDDQGTVQLYAVTDTGAGWSAPSLVLPNSLPQHWTVPPAVALHGGQIFVGWGEWRGEGRGQIMLARRGLSEDAWRYTQVSPTTESDWCFHEHPALRVDGSGTVHLLWSGCALRNPPDHWPHDSAIFYAASTNGGESFTAPLRVGLTVAQDDEDFHNNTASRPALALADNGAVMVLYPARVEGSWTFYTAQIEEGGVTASARIGELNSGWVIPDTYAERWYDGDSAGAVSYDAQRDRFIAIFPDRRNGRTPTLYTAIFGGDNPAPTPTPTPSKIFLPQIEH
jgi:hypothetical protein